MYIHYIVGTVYFNVHIYFPEVRFHHPLFAFTISSSSTSSSVFLFSMTRSRSTFEGTWKKWKGTKGRVGNYQNELFKRRRGTGGAYCRNTATWRLVTMRLWDRRPHLEPRTGGENKRGLTRDGKSAGGAVDVTTKRKITWRNFLALLHWKLK